MLSLTAAELVTLWFNQEVLGSMGMAKIAKQAIEYFKTQLCISMKDTISVCMYQMRKLIQ